MQENDQLVFVTRVLEHFPFAGEVDAMEVWRKCKHLDLSVAAGVLTGLRESVGDGHRIDFKILKSLICDVTPQGDDWAQRTQRQLLAERVQQQQIEERDHVAREFLKALSSAERVRLLGAFLDTLPAEDIRQRRRGQDTAPASFLLWINETQLAAATAA